MCFSQFLCLILSQICQYDQKHTLFFQFCMFCTPKRCMRVHCLVLKNNPNYVFFFFFFFYEDDIQLQIQVAPLGEVCPSKRWVNGFVVNLAYHSIFCDVITQPVGLLTEEWERGVLTLKRVKGMGRGEYPFSTLPQLLLKAPFQHLIFSVPQDPHLNQKSPKIPNFLFKMLNLVNCQFISLKISQNPLPEASFGPKLKKKERFSKPPNLAPICSTSPQTPLPFWNVSTPSELPAEEPDVSHAWFPLTYHRTQEVFNQHYLQGFKT